MIKDSIFFKKYCLCNAIVSDIDTKNQIINCILLRDCNSIRAILRFSNIDENIQNYQQFFYPQRIILCKIIDIKLRHHSYEILLSNKNDDLISVKDFFHENEKNTKILDKFAINEDEDFTIKEIKKLKDIQKLDSEKVPNSKLLKYSEINMENEQFLMNSSYINIKKFFKCYKNIEYRIRPSFLGENHLILTFRLIEDIYLNYDIEIIKIEVDNYNLNNEKTYITHYKIENIYYKSLNELVDIFATKMAKKIKDFKKNDYFRGPGEIQNLLFQIFNIKNNQMNEKEIINDNKMDIENNDMVKFNDVMNDIVLGFMRESPEYGLLFTKASNDYNYCIDFIKILFNGYLFHGKIFNTLYDLINFYKDVHKTNHYQNFIKRQFICNIHSQIEEIDEQYIEFEGPDPNSEKFYNNYIQTNEMKDLKDNLLFAKSSSNMSIDTFNNNSLIGKKRKSENNIESGWDNNDQIIDTNNFEMNDINDNDNWAGVNSEKNNKFDNNINSFGENKKYKNNNNNKNNYNKGNKKFDGNKNSRNKNQNNNNTSNNWDNSNINTNDLWDSANDNNNNNDSWNNSNNNNDSWGNNPSNNNDSWGSSNNNNNKNQVWGKPNNKNSNNNSNNTTIPWGKSNNNNDERNTQNQINNYDNIKVENNNSMNNNIKIETDPWVDSNAGSSWDNSNNIINNIISDNNNNNDGWADSNNNNSTNFSNNNYNKNNNKNSFNKSNKNDKRNNNKNKNTGSNFSWQNDKSNSHNNNNSNNNYNKKNKNNKNNNNITSTFDWPVPNNENNNDDWANSNNDKQNNNYNNSNINMNNNIDWGTSNKNKSNDNRGNSDNNNSNTYEINWEGDNYNSNNSNKGNDNYQNKNNYNKNNDFKKNNNSNFNKNNVWGKNENNNNNNNSNLNKKNPWGKNENNNNKNKFFNNNNNNKNYGNNNWNKNNNNKNNQQSVFSGWDNSTSSNINNDNNQFNSNSNNNNSSSNNKDFEGWFNNKKDFNNNDQRANSGNKKTNYNKNYNNKNNNNNANNNKNYNKKNNNKNNNNNNNNKKKKSLWREELVNEFDGSKDIKQEKDEGVINFNNKDAFGGYNL